MIAAEELAVTIISGSGDILEGLVDFSFRVRTLEVEEDLVDTLRVGSEVKTGSFGIADEQDEHRGE